MQSFDRLGNEGRGTDDFNAWADQARIESRRVDGIGDIDPVQARIRDKLCRIASEQSMRSKGMNLPRAMLQTCLRGPYDCSARADEIVDHEYDPIFDLTDKKTSCDFPSAAALLNKCT